MKKAWLALVFGSALFLAACGGNNDEGAKDNNTGTQVTDEATNDTTNDTTNDNVANEGTNGATNDAALAQGETLVKQSCVSCHGGDLKGMGNTPALADVGSRLSEEEILNVIVNGRGGMPPGLLKGEEAEAAAAWLATQK